MLRYRSRFRGLARAVAVFVVVTMVSWSANTSVTADGESDTNEPPVVSGADEVDFTENGVGVVGTYAATDPEGVTVTWGVSGDDGAVFGISSGGVLSFDSPPDFEDPDDADGDNRYLVTVEASDGSLTGSLDVVVTVGDVNEPPVVSGVEAVGYAENGVGVVGTYAATDPEGVTVTWGVSGDDGAVFGISSGGVLSFDSPPDFEDPDDADGDNRYLVTVEASDGSLTGSLDVVVTVGDVNEPPVVSGVEAVGYAENGVGVVGTYAATDPEGVTVTWGVSGDDGAVFGISSGGVLSFDSPPDFEDPDDADGDNRYLVTVEASDGSLTGSLDVVVTVGDVNEPPVVSGADEVDFTENGVGVVGTYAATDPEGVTVTWGVSGDDGAVFGISSGGVLSFDSPPDFEDPDDADGDNRYLVTVEASDGSLTGSLDVVVTVGDVNEPPVVSGVEAVGYAENGVGVVGTYAATDPEGVTVTWGVSGDDGAVFGISSGGVLSFDSPPDFEDPDDADGDNRYLVTVEASDGSETAGLDVIVTVTDLTVSGPEEIGYVENGTGAVGTYAANGAVTWGLSGDDSDDFGISSGGVLSFGSSPDFENPDDADGDNRYLVTVEASDGSETAGLDVIVTVTDLTVSGAGVVGYAENGTGAVGTYAANGAVTWGLSGDDSDDFGISSGGVLSFGGSPDFEDPDDADGDNQYRVTVEASDGSLTGSLDVVVTVDDVNEPPTGLTATAGFESVTLRWADPNNVSISGYEYRQSTDSGATFGEFTLISGSDAATTTYTITGLTIGVAYTFEIRAVYSGVPGPSSDQVTATPALLFGLTGFAVADAVAGTPAVLVSNTGETTSGKTTTVLNEHAQGFNTGKNTLGYVLTSVELDIGDAPVGGTLTVSVRADDGGGGPGDPVLHALTNPGSVGTGLQVFTAAADAGLDANTHYFMHIAFTGGTPPQWSFTDSNGDTAANAGWNIDNDRRLRASGSNWTTPSPSTVIQIKVNGYSRAPAAPTNLSALPSDGQVVLSWDDPDNDTITKYQYSTDGGTNFTDIGSSSASTTTHTIMGLNNGTTYMLAVRAVNSGREGAASTVAVVMVPAAPTGLVAVTGDRQVRLGWSYPGDSSSITGFQYQQKTGGDFGDDWTDITGSTAGTTSHIVTGLTNETEYTFAVRAVNVTIAGARAEAPGATPAAAGERPAKPTNFSAAQTGVGQVELRWNAAQQPLTVTGYEYTDDGGSDWKPVSGSDSSTVSYTVPDLIEDTTYTFAVQAVNSAGYSNSSNSRSVTIIAKPLRPVGVGADAGDTQAKVRWRRSGDPPITKFQLLQVPQSKLTAGDSADNDEYGYSVAIDGDTAVIGAYQHDVTPSGGAKVDNAGAAYVFIKDSAGQWRQTAKLTASDGAVDDEFGVSVAIDGDTVVVGAHQHDANSNSDAGAVYVFTKSGDNWTDGTETAKLTASDGAVDDEFGVSVAIDGDTVVVGAHQHDANSNSDAGAVYVFTKSGDNWTDGTETAKLTASDGAVDDEFGVSVAIDGDTVVVGAHQHDANSNSDAGAVYVFTKSGDNWTDGTETAKLTASDGAVDDEFGVSVAIDGDTVVVGAHQHDANSNSDAGAAYVFARDSNSGKWSQTAKLTASDGAVDDEFGISVALDGDDAVVGAYLDTNSLLFHTDAGSAYVFARGSDGWRQSLKLAAPDAAANDHFGYSVAVANGTVLAGAPQDDDNGDDSGSAYLMDISDAKWADFESEELTVSGSSYEYRVLGLTNGQEYTFRVRSVNHVGNDPSAEFVSATPQLAIPGKATGLSAQAGNRRVYLNWDRSDDSTITGYQVLPHQQTKLSAGSDGEFQGKFGESVAVDGDTVVVGAYQHDVNTYSNAGEAYVFVRRSSGWRRQVELSASDGAKDDLFGYSVAVDGDTVVVGAYQHDVNSNSDAGAAYVFVRAPNSGVWSQAAKLTAFDGAEDDLFGYSVAVDGDTVVVGARGDDGKKGAAYVFTKPNTDNGWADIDVTTAVKLTASDGDTFDYFGHSVAVDDDTIVIGAHQHDLTDGQDTGSAYVSTKDSGTGVWGQPAKLTADDYGPDDQFGWSVAVDGDTVVVGARKNNAAYVFIWDSVAWRQAAKLIASDSDGNEEFGDSVAVRDSTIVVGAYSAYSTNENADNPHSGAAYVFTKPATGWANDLSEDHITERAKLILPGGGGADEKAVEFGDSVALDGQYIVVGVPGHDVAAVDDNFGSVYVSDIPVWTHIRNSKATTTSHTVRGLNHGVEYTFQVRAVDGVGEGSGSNVVRARPFRTTGGGEAQLLTDPCDYAPTPFMDVPQDSFAFDAVACIYNLGITGGTSLSTYSPDAPVTRAQMAAFLSSLYTAVVGKPARVVEHPFVDVGGSFAEDDIARIFGMGVTSGTSLSTYSPDAPVTRAQMAAFLSSLYTAVVGKPARVVEHPFVDVGGSFAEDDIARIFGMGVTSGTSLSTYSPDAPVTRAQMAAFLARLYKALVAASR